MRLRERLFTKSYFKLKTVSENIIFLTQNIILAINLKRKNIVLNKNIIIRPYYRSEINKITFIYETFNGKAIGFKLKILLALLGPKLSIVALEKKSGKLIGVIIFYFNRRDVKEHTIHEAFIGILPEWQGRGIGTLLRQQAINYFKANGLKGISSRVSIFNHSSININKKLGYEIIESYYDHSLMESRVYMQLHFNDNDSNES